MLRSPSLPPAGASSSGRHSPLALQDEHHVVDAHVVADEVCAQQPGVCVADVEGLETLAQLVGRSNGSQWAGQVLPGARVVSTCPPLCHLPRTPQDERPPPSCASPELRSPPAAQLRLSPELRSPPATQLRLSPEPRSPPGPLTAPPP